MTVTLWETYESARTDLIDALHGEPALARLTGDDQSDWIFGLFDAWAALAEVVGFYQQRILEEGFLLTAEQPGSIELIYHSLGHEFLPNATATTTVAYQLNSTVAGVEAVKRAGAAGGTGMSPEARAQLAASGPSNGAAPPAASAGGPSAGPGGVPGVGSVGAPAGVSTGTPNVGSPASSLGTASAIPGAAQVRAVPASTGTAPTFVTLSPLAAYVGASRLAVNVASTAPPVPLTTATTQLELAGTKTGLAVGQPVLISATPAAGASPLRWMRIVTSLRADSQRNSTRIGWDAPLGSLAGEPSPDAVSAPIVYGFAQSTGLVAAGAPDWAAQTTLRQLATTTASGLPLPTRGGVATSTDDGATWSLQSAGLPAGVELTAVGVYGGVTVVSAGASGLLRSAGGAPFAPVTIGGGSRRPVGFLGGTATRMLAGASNGVVYQSVDQGQTWTAVTGGPPTVEISDDGATRTVETHQLPSATVRCVLEDPESPQTEAAFPLLAATDAGLYSNSNGGWAAVPGFGDQPAVFALLQRADGTLVAGTADGLLVPGDSPPSSPPQAPVWSAPDGGPPAPVTALAEVAGALYAAAGGSVWTDAGGTWQAAGGALPSGTSINALLGVDETLLAATGQGIYRAPLPGPVLTWTRCDHAAAFTFPAADAPPAGSTAPGTALVADFAEYGIELSPGATLSAATPGWVLADGGHVYALTPPAEGPGPWQVMLLDAMPVARGLAGASGGPVLAVGSAAATAANEWPGFEVAGASIEIAPPVRGVVPGAPALIEQRTASPAATALALTAVEQDSAVRVGRTTPLTRLHFTQNLPAGEFPRRASTVWTGAATLDLFDPPNPDVPVLTGSSIELASVVTAPLDPGRLVAVTGAAPALAVAPLGGAIRIASAKATPETMGPPEADLTGVAIGADGTVYLAGTEGVFALPSAKGITGAGAPELLADGWPGGGSNAVAVAGATVLAASEQGVQQLVASEAGARWVRVTRQTGSVDALASDGTRAVATFADGTVLEAADAATQPAVWTQLPNLEAPVTALTLDPGSSIYAANANRVFVLSGDAWSGLGPVAVPGTVTSLQLDDRGTLWGGSTGGLQSYNAAAREWRREPQVVGKVQALCRQPSGILTVAGVHAVGELRGTTWTGVSSAPGATLAGLAGAADGSLWIAAHASVPVLPDSGAAEFALQHTPVVLGVTVTDRDLQTLMHGGIPDSVLSAFADSDVSINTATAIVTLRSTGCWLIRVGDALFIVAKRTARGRQTVDVYRNLAVVYPTAPVTTSGGAQSWTVTADGVVANLTVQSSRVVTLPAPADAPTLAEMGAVAAAPAGAETVSRTLGGTTTVSLQQPLQYVYDASTVQVNLNVVPAAAGQSVSVPIGNGDPQQANQSFTTPTPVAAIGAPPGSPPRPPATSLRVYVDGNQWTSVSTLRPAAPDDTVYVTRQKTDGRMIVIFGDGVHGARVPAGTNNVVATYLQGGGPDSEVAPGALIQPLDRPQLVTAVHNPAPALRPPMPSAGAARLAAVRRLDRTITVEDYEDLVLAQPGVTAARVEILAGPVGRAIVISVALGPTAPARPLITLAGVIGTSSASGLPVRIVRATPVTAILSLRVISARAPTAIEPAVRGALAGLHAVRPGDPLRASAVLTAATAVPGVIAAQIAGWERVGDPTRTSTTLTAAGGQWPGDAAAPTGAELLALDPAQKFMQIEVEAPPR